MKIKEAQFEIKVANNRNDRATLIEAVDSVGKLAVMFPGGGCKQFGSHPH